MVRSKTLSFLMAIAVSAPLASGAAHAEAIVGSTTSIAAPAPAAPAPDQIKALYRRPDSVPFPDADRYTPAKALLGQMLFHDTRLSGSGRLACASCHNPALGYGDGLPKAIGHNMKPLPRRSPSIINGAWGELLMWDGSAESLEAQALSPIASREEMNQPLTRLVPMLSAIQTYKSMFAAAFPQSTMTPVQIADALATYERTIVSGRAPFDSWIDGDDSAISAAAKRGFALFNAKARCAFCHSSWNFTDNGFHDIGLPDDDRGRGRLFPRVIKMQHAFKTPSLRDVAHRGPFMHDGSLPTLNSVVAFYDSGGANRLSQSELVGPLNLSSEDQADIVAFLQSLASPVERDVVAALPR